MNEKHQTGSAAIRFVVVATTGFLTLVDLFAAQAILPFLTAAYGDALSRKRRGRQLRFSAHSPVNTSTAGPVMWT